MSDRYAYNPCVCDNDERYHPEERGAGNVSKRVLDPWKDLQAVSVPPHGRSIDADALIEDLERQCKEVFRVDAVSPDDYWITRDAAYKEALWKSWVESFGDYLKTRPTVIEAEV